jgi:peptidoglycan glycosyltransferase
LKKEKEKNQKQHNTRMTAVGYFFTGLFLVMVFYLIYFTAVRRADVVNNSYNKRLEALEEEMLRGDIVAADGTVLARSVEYEDGTMQRLYPYGNIFSHVVGISTKGKSGIEKLTNYFLLTSNENIFQKISKRLEGSRLKGDSVVTTLDVSLQQAAYDALGNNRGAVVVMEPSTGKLLAMVSKPDFDPNMIDYTWEDILTSSDTVLFNRATQGLYPPGSTFKILTLLEFMRENPDYADYTYDCDGSIYRGGLVLNCINGTAHGANNLKQAFAVSCNSAFADIGLSLDKEKLIETAQNMLYNQSLPYSLEYNESSFSMTVDCDEAMVMQTSIGQGETLISPLHSCMIASAIANGGVLMKPYLVSEVRSTDGTYSNTFEPQQYGELLTKDEAAALTEYMQAVVTDGTAYSFRNAPYTCAGKTGSAQYDSSSKHHSWFVGFAPAEEPQFAICVLLEGGYSGVSGAHEVARSVLDVYLDEKNY